jgi:hypothetical protein
MMCRCTSNDKNIFRGRYHLRKLCMRQRLTPSKFRLNTTSKSGDLALERSPLTTSYVFIDFRVVTRPHQYCQHHRSQRNSHKFRSNNQYPATLLLHGMCGNSSLLFTLSTRTTTPIMSYKGLYQQMLWMEPHTSLTKENTIRTSTAIYRGNTLWMA